MLQNALFPSTDPALTGNGTLNKYFTSVQLLPDNRKHLAIGGPDGPVRRGQIAFDHFMQLGQIIIRHQREHVMFNVIVHIQINKPAERIHQNGTCIQPVISYIVTQAAMLKIAGHIEMPGPVKARRAD